MKKSNFYKVLVIALLSALSWTTSAQSDTCYTKEQNRKIAEKLIEGENAKKEVASLNNLYSLSQQETKMLENAFKVQTLELEALKIEKAKQEEMLRKKIKRRNIWIYVLAAMNLAQAAN